MAGHSGSVPSKEYVLPFEGCERPWRNHLFVAIVASLVAIAGPPLINPLLASSNSSVRNRIAATDRGSFVRNLERVAFSSDLRIMHPYTLLEDTAREMLFQGQEDELSEVKRSEVADIFLMPSLKHLPLYNVRETLSLLRFFEYADEEYRLISSVIKKNPDTLDEGELSNWIRVAYSDVAKEHFKRNEYFLGRSNVQDGIKLARLRKIPNLHGSDGLAKDISPFIIIEGFLPLTLGKLPPPERNLSQQALLILNDEFAELATMSDSTELGLSNYAAGVNALRTNDFDAAASLFASVRDQVQENNARDLSAFMTVRSTFWSALTALHNAQPRQKGTQQGEHGSANLNLSSDEAEPTPSEDKLEKAAKFFSKALAYELAKFFSRVSNAKPSVQSEKNSNRNKEKQVRARIANACSSGNERLKEAQGKIETVFWNDQSIPYIKTFKRECDELK